MPVHQAPAQPTGQTQPTSQALPTRHTSQPHRRSVPATAIFGLAAAGLLAVLWLWWTGQPGADVAAGHHQNLTRLSGLLAGYSIIWLTCLITRPPVLERSLGSHRLTTWHRRLGTGALALTAVHLVSLEGHPATWTMGLAHVAAGAMALLAVTNLPVVRHRLPYTTWHAAHWLGYCLLWLGLSHQLAQGGDLARHPLIAAAWVCGFGAGLVGLLYSRLIRPLTISRRHRLRVARVVQEAPNVVSVYLTGQGLAGLAAQAGQYCRWRFLAPGLWGSTNPYSLSALPDGRQLRITVAQVGGHSRRLSLLRAGTPVLMEGPYGTITADCFTRPRAVLVAGGSGIGPVLALAQALVAAGQSVTVIYRSRGPGRPVLGTDLDQLAGSSPTGTGEPLPQVQVHYLVGPRTDPANALTAERLITLAPGLDEASVFICGSPGFTATVRQAALAAGLPRAHLLSESFG